MLYTCFNEAYRAEPISASTPTETGAPPEYRRLSVRRAPRLQAAHPAGAAASPLLIKTLAWIARHDDDIATT
jgi:hypothetical protein